jgi:hypothetical protein
MFANLSIGTVAITATVFIHTFGLISVSRAIGWLTARFRLHGHRSRVLAMNSVVLGLLVVLSVEIWLWACVFLLVGVVDDFSTALYFSTITFSTVGYGDVVPHPEWRLLAALEGINGFLLIGWSTAYLVAAGVRFGPFRSGEHF